MPQEQEPSTEDRFCYDIEEIDENIDIGSVWIALCVEYMIDPCWQEVSITRWGGVMRWDPWHGRQICFPCDGYICTETYTFDEFKKRKKEIIDWIAKAWVDELTDYDLNEADGLTENEIEALEKVGERIDELEDKVYKKAEEAVNKIEKVIEYYKTYKLKEEDCY